VEFRILGPLEVVEHGRALPLGGVRQRTLLALLLTRANEVVSADRLIDELWGAQPPQTPANALQYHVSQLRKALAPRDAIVTQEPGYVIRLGPDELDLLRFELLVEEALESAPELAAQRLRDALALWRGPPLADLGHESLQTEILRLEELRLAALERRLDADLALGRFAELVGEVQVLVREHPLRERLRAALMRALYGSGRQVEALEIYRETRRLLVDQLGLEPSPALQELEQAILRHDPALSSQEAPAVARQRAIMVVAGDAERLDDLLAIAEPLARRPARELILVRLLRDDGELAVASAALSERRDALAQQGVASRTVAYTTSEPGADTVQLATEHDVDLVLLDVASELLESGRPDHELTVVLERAPCDVAVLVGGGEKATGPLVTPFGGVEHDWAAIELAAWLAQSLGTTLRLLGTRAEPAIERRDASRLLARASMLVQQVIGIVAEPVLVRPGEGGVLEAARDARLLVVGLSERWRTEGIGHARLAVAVGAEVPTLFVRRGLRPGGVAPNETLTRFTWTLGSERVLPPPVSEAPRSTGPPAGSPLL
jgi:DNA-binding SARP family transcriptional activator